MTTAKPGPGSPASPPRRPAVLGRNRNRPAAARGRGRGALRPGLPCRSVRPPLREAGDRPCPLSIRSQIQRPASSSTRCRAGRSYDPHTHIDPHRPAARHFDEILGYHYYTELAHSAGMPAQLVAPDLDPTAARPESRRVSRSHRLDGPVFLAAGDRADISSISARSDHAREHRRASRSRQPRARRRGVGPRGLEDQPAGSRVSHQRIRRHLWTAGTRRRTCRACGPTTWS